MLARHLMAPGNLERRNANLIGGDIGAWAMDFRQLLFRPALRLDPHTTPVKGLYICSASTPPGGGANGMCGHLAALAVLREH